MPGILVDLEDSSYILGSDIWTRFVTVAVTISLLKPANLPIQIITQVPREALIIGVPVPVHGDQ